MGKIIIIGSGQLAQSLFKKFPDAKVIGYPEIDISNEESVKNVFSKIPAVSVIFNAAAWTDVDGAEIPENEDKVFGVNGTGVKYLAEQANRLGAILVHISSDYVFDGTKPKHQENEAVNPLNIYGKSKAVGEENAKIAKKHYIIRTSWLIGDSFPQKDINNFVKTVFKFAKDGKDFSVVNDQFGRLTFTSELVRIIKYLIDCNAKYGVYNVSNSGDVSSWAQIAKEVYALTKRFSPVELKGKVSEISTNDYFAKSPKEYIAVRPTNSDFSLRKIEQLGIYPYNWSLYLKGYIENLFKEMS